jgi:predicted  nucleic acid-binding Zn-ribbon protein
MMFVRCTACGRKYDHGLEEGKQLTCPSCSSNRYAREAQTEQRREKPLHEDRNPRLLVEG